MLQRIIRAFFFVIPLLAFTILATSAGESSLLRFYYATSTEYQSYLEEIRSLGQDTFVPRGTNVWGLKDFRTVAHVLRLRLSPTKFTDAQVDELARHIIRLSHRTHFTPAFILSMIDVESRFIPTAVSGHGAIGLMQLMPATGTQIAAELSMPYDGERSLRDPVKNIELGLQYMVELRRKFKQPRHYLAAYNIGPTALLRKLRSGEPLSDSYYNKVVRSYREYSTGAL